MSNVLRLQTDSFENSETHFKRECNFYVDFIVFLYIFLSLRQSYIFLR